MQRVFTVSVVDNIHGPGQPPDFLNAQRVIKERTVIKPFRGNIKKDYPGSPIRYAGAKEQLEKLGADTGKIQGG